MASKIIYTARLTGLDELRRRLRGLDEKLQARILTEAVDGGGAVIEDLARSFVPRRTWALSNSITRHTRRSSRGDNIAICTVGIDKNRREGGVRPVWYAHLMEFGFTARDGLRIAPHPFIRPALQRGANLVRATMISILRAGLVRAARNS